MTNLLHTFEVGAEPRSVDYHMHTEFSDGSSTVAEYAEAANRLGLEEIAITDHVWRRSDWVDEYIDEIKEINEVQDIRIIAGLEAKVIDREGHVDVSDSDAEKVDFVMGVVHRYRPEASAPYDDSLELSPEEAADEECNLTLKMMENPRVDVVGHPARTYYKFHYGDGTPDFPDRLLRRMIDQSRETGTPLEYNARLPQGIRERQLELFIDHQLPFTAGSDSHHADQLGRLNHDRIASAIMGNL